MVGFVCVVLQWNGERKKTEIRRQHRVCDGSYRVQKIKVMKCSLKGGLIPLVPIGEYQTEEIKDGDVDESVEKHGNEIQNWKSAMETSSIVDLCSISDREGGRMDEKDLTNTHSLHRQRTDPSRNNDGVLEESWLQSDSNARRKRPMKQLTIFQAVKKQLT